jgi:zinc transport system ATP-binding protein
VEITGEIMSEKLLEVSHFTVALDRAPVFSDLNFRVDEGEFLTILGPNGAGKTVLLKSLLGLLPHEGSLTWFKAPKIGYLPQGLNQLSVKDMPLTVGDFFGFKNIGYAEALEHLSHVGLDRSVLDKSAGYLSGGEFQRMLIAWVLSSNPNVLFLDEPTTAIDVAGDKTIYSLLKDIKQKHSLTIFNVTHDLNIVYAHSTHVLCLSRLGHRCFGVPKEVLTPDVLNDIYGSPIKFYTH